MGKRRRPRPAGSASAGASARRRGRPWLYYTLVGAVVAAGLTLLANGIRARSAAPLPEGAQRITISMSGFTPAEIQGLAGEPVTVVMENLDNQFHSDGEGTHNFILEALGVDKLAKPKETITFTFTPTAPGEYPFYCDICCGGKENPYMWGKLVVT